MNTEEIVKNQAQPWVPMTNHNDIKCIGKLMEELNELSSILSRSLIQGIDQPHVDDGRLNLEHVCDEIADVQNMLEYFERRFLVGSDIERIIVRRERKFQFIKGWLEPALEAHSPEVEEVFQEHVPEIEK